MSRIRNRSEVRSSNQKQTITPTKAQHTWAALPFELSAINADLLAIIGKEEIASEIISESFGISPDGVDHIVERLERMMPSQTVTNGHVFAVLLGEISAGEGGPWYDTRFSSPYVCWHTQRYLQPLLGGSTEKQYTWGNGYAVRA